MLPETLSLCDAVKAFGPATPLEDIALKNLEILMAITDIKLTGKVEPLECETLRGATENLCSLALAKSKEDLEAGSNVFIDCLGTFETLFLGPKNAILFGSTLTDDTVETVALALAYYLVARNLVQFDIVTQAITERAEFNNPLIMTMKELHESLLGGCLEESILLIERTQQESKHEGLAHLTEQLKINIRDKIAASLECSYKTLSLDKTLSALHLKSSEELKVLIDEREQNYKSAIEALAILPPDEEDPFNKAESILTRKLEHHDLMTDAYTSINQINWKIKGDTVIFTPACSMKQTLVHDMAELNELGRLRGAFKFGEYLEATL